jgi:hypothetical protein
MDFSSSTLDTEKRLPDPAGFVIQGWRLSCMDIERLRVWHGGGLTRGVFNTYLKTLCVQWRPLKAAHFALIR